MSLAPHEFWQEIHPPLTFRENPAEGFRDLYPARLPDGRQIALPIRTLPGDGSRAVASLIVNQASFALEDALSDTMTAALRPLGADVVIGVPTLGLPLANAVARRLGHPRMVALGTSRKFWYDEGLSEPMSSITSPEQIKRLYLDPRMLPLLRGKRVAVVDDVISSAASMRAVLALLSKAGVAPIALVFAMLQTERWRPVLQALDPALPGKVYGALRTPLLARRDDGGWAPTG
ncbi:phosphoribosyltransferase [Aquibium carbonis]|uniref:Phosphoribosyltransferase n=1 Tax=Aquibium carbonis TaxID=2495581 RepID=A0A3S0A8T6_9HYPH|nr:phosphoribosyltransferase [Aquibium carbonis]RST87301.1 phosphoribosyltransferase [Aquibium carbonis]